MGIDMVLYALRKTNIFPHRGTKQVRPSMFGMPTEDVFRSGKWYIEDVCQIAKFIELGAAENLMLYFSKILQEINQTC